MGTCFTKSQHINGRQNAQPLSRPRHNSDATFNNILESQNLESKEVTRQSSHNTHETSSSIHGKNGIQSTYNRWVCRQQKLTTLSQPFDRSPQSNTGKYNSCWRTITILCVYN